MKRLLLATVLALLAAGFACAANPVVVVETSMGNMKVELFEDKAPVTVQNFLAYVDDKHYDGTIFHRVIGKPNSEKDFVIQAGGFGTDKKEKPVKAAIANESSNGLSNTRGTIAMARISAPDSAAAQFYINVVDNAQLDRARFRDQVGYCVFGKVIDGMDVADKIKAVKIGTATLETRSGNDASSTVPVEDVVIKSIRRDTAAKP